MKKISRTELFLQLAQPNESGVSRWVKKSEFTGEYKDLYFENGFSWGRASSPLAQKYIVEVDKNITSGNTIDAIRLNGFNTASFGTQAIRKDIWNHYANQRCVVLDTGKPEVDHKNGWKNSERVMNLETQEYSDFQPLSKASNDAKRQHCKNCRNTGIRFDAKKLGYPIAYYSGNEKHIGEETGCIGCFWYDPIEFRKHLKFTGN